MAYSSDHFTQSNAPEIAIRRDLHRYPETAFLEYRTASRIAESLEVIGYSVRTGREAMAPAAIVNPPSAEIESESKADALAHGGVARWIDQMAGGLTAVVAEKRFGDGPVLALRFDMDALALDETDRGGHAPHDGGFASVRPGRMHGCGHDGHVAIGFCVAAALAQAEGLAGTLRFIFQPAEEGGRGAQPIIDAGILDDVDHIFVAHLGCFLASGKVAASAIGFLWSSKIEVRFDGRPSHAAMAPQAGRNALLAGAAAASNLHAISRVAGEETFVNVGRMTAGTTFNIIPDRCDLMMEVRAESEAGHAYMMARAEEIVAASAAMQGVTSAMRVVSRLEGNHNSPEAVDTVARAVRTLPGIELVDSWPIGGGDDASKMIRRVQENGGTGAYFIIGSDIPAPHHAPDFDIDEGSLAIGRQVFEHIVREILGKAERQA
ncbi:MAG: amidohydrolase [Rhodobacteraceae bacterium]|nr:amidohydrolase [Paracoccaceae bacterium]MCC0066908.1 amidohydrolase [Rhodovulum sp.]